jgi:2,3-bisphosphoglycerate-independent phosphoglycerate mutase
MKYIVLVGDGMADYPIEGLGKKTPLEAAKTANMDFIARHGRLGRIKTIPDNLTPGSDVAIISILGYDPNKYYSGRGPLEAANLGISLGQSDIAFRCNLITAGEDNLIDYSAGHISSKEAEILIRHIDEKLGTDKIKFYPGVSYRHVMVINEAEFPGLEKVSCKPPHDIIGQSISKNLPKGKDAEVIIKLMSDSKVALEGHEINMVRIDLKENPANMIWLWGQGKSPALPKFADKYGLKGSVISAVDLIKGLGRILGLEVINVPGATGYYDTDYKGKAEAALKALKNNDFVFVHVEAPDEAGHNGDLREKITAIERFDQMVVGTILNAYKRKKNFRILVLPDHATPVSVRTHTRDPVFFGIFGNDIFGAGFSGYNEKEAQKSELYLENGYELMDYFIKGPDKT